jgi:hypothetical protein
VSEQQPVKPSLVRKLAEIMALVHRIPKRGRNDFHGYDYATEADIVEAVRGELAKRNLMILPRVTRREAVNIVRTTNKGDKSVMLTFADMTFAVEDGDSGEVREFPWTGCGEDGGDKGIYKAMTGAEKYFLMKLFLIPTGDDPETDKRRPKQHADSRQRPVARPANGAPLVSEAQAGEIRKLVADAGIAKADALSELRKVCGAEVKSAAEIPADKFEAVKAALEKARPAAVSA